MAIKNRNNTIKGYIIKRLDDVQELRAIQELHNMLAIIEQGECVLTSWLEYQNVYEF